MPQSIHSIFEQFMSGLSSLIKEKVSEAVTCATNEFLNSKFAVGSATAKAPKPVRRRRRRRGRKQGPKAAVKSGPQPKKRGPGRPPKSGPKPVRLSKNGKRLGRPPKASTEEKSAE